MAILFAANEAEAFALTTTAEQRTATDQDTNFNPSGRGVRLSGSALLTTPVFTAQTELWVKVAIGPLGTASVSSTQPFVMLKDTGGGTIFLQLDADANGNFNLEYWNGASYTEIGSADFAPVSGGATLPITFTIHIILHNTTGVFECWMDDVLQWRYTGDTIFTGFTQCDQVILGSINSTTGSLYSTTVSELIVSTTPTWGYRVCSKVPSGDSATNTAWTGVYTDIDDAGVVADGDTNTVDVNGDVETYTCGALGTTPALMVPIAVITAFRGQNSGAGSANNIKHCIRRSGTNYYSASVTGLSATLAPYIEVWALDPSTSAAWSVSGVDAAEFGYQAVT